MVYINATRAVELGGFEEAAAKTGWSTKFRKTVRQLFLRAMAPKDKELELMQMEMGIKAPINSRNWKRHSALLVYSKYQ